MSRPWSFGCNQSTGARHRDILDCKIDLIWPWNKSRGGFWLCPTLWATGIRHTKFKGPLNKTQMFRLSKSGARSNFLTDYMPSEYNTNGSNVVTLFGSVECEINTDRANHVNLQNHVKSNHWSGSQSTCSLWVYCAEYVGTGFFVVCRFYRCENWLHRTF